MEELQRMEELQEIAKAYYKAADKKTKKAAKDFFKSMDDDGNKKINLQEFVDFMKAQGYHKQMSNCDFFTLLNRDGSGTLNFDQVKTLFYIIKSGRPVCDGGECGIFGRGGGISGRGCGIFVTGLYFTCVKCFDNGSEAFNVCSTCFKDQKYKHHQHNSHKDFLDNFVLLESKRMKASNSAPISNSAEAGSSSTSLAVTHDAAKMEKMKIAFNTLSLAIGIGGIVSNVTCSIM